MKIYCQCVKCNHSGIVEVSDLLMHDFYKIFSRLVCTKCGGRVVKSNTVSGHTMSQLFAHWLDKGADVHGFDAFVNESVARFVDCENKTLLHCAKTPELVKLLIARGADVNQKDKYGKSPIFYADDPEIINLLVKNGANEYLIDNDGYFPPVAYKKVMENQKRYDDWCFPCFFDLNERYWSESSEFSYYAEMMKTLEEQDDDVLENRRINRKIVGEIPADTEDYKFINSDW